MRASHRSEDRMSLSPPVRGTLIDLRIRAAEGVAYQFLDEANRA